MNQPVHTAPDRAGLLVTGSAGFVGKSLLRRLTDTGRTVTSLYNAHLPEPMAHVQPVFADMLRPEHMSNALRNVNTVVHLAWSRSFHARWEEALWVHDGDRQDSRNIMMVKNLVQAMEDAKAQRIVFVSALGASRHADSWYLREKYFAEAVILNSKIPEKVILRSSLVFGEINTQDRLIRAIGRLMRFPWFYPIPKWSSRLAPIHVNDLSDTIIRLIDLELASGAHVLEVDGDEQLELEDLFRFVSRGMGKGSHWALKGLLGQALTPLFEYSQRRDQEHLPHLRDLLTIGSRRDLTTKINNPTQSHLPTPTRRFEESMNTHKN